MTEKISQTTKILEALKDGEEISPLDALNRFGCFRLGARVYDLRWGKYDGVCYPIEQVAHKGKQYAIYKLSPEALRH